MSDTKPSLPAQSSEPHAALWAYVAGFVLSVLLTLLAYWLVVYGSLSTVATVSMISGLAILQLLVQLIFFVHLDQERKPRWNLMVLLFAVLVVVIICFGSLWIMKNLNYHAPMHDNIDEQMMKNEGIYR